MLPPFAFASLPHITTHRLSFLADLARALFLCVPRAAAMRFQRLVVAYEKLTDSAERARREKTARYEAAARDLARRSRPSAARAPEVPLSSAAAETVLRAAGKAFFGI